MSTCRQIDQQRDEGDVKDCLDAQEYGVQAGDAHLSRYEIDTAASKVRLLLFVGQQACTSPSLTCPEAWAMTLSREPKPFTMVAKPDRHPGAMKPGCST